MKLTYTNKIRRMRMEVTNPNEEIQRWTIDQMKAAYAQGYRELLTDVEQAIRKVKVGQRLIVKGYPLVIEVSRDATR